MTKALLIGALPYQFEGPWVPMNGAQVWRYDPNIDFNGNVLLEYRDDTSSPVAVPLNHTPVEFKADYARIVVPDRFDFQGSFTIEVQGLK